MGWDDLLIGGTSLLSSLSSLFGSSESSDSMSEYADALQQIADLQTQQYTTSEDIAQQFRDVLYPQLLTALGSTDTSTLTSLPVYSTSRSGLEDQYSVAKESLGSMASGGGLTAALANLETARASDVGSIPGDLYNTLMGYGMDLAGLNLGTDSLSSASTTTSNLLDTYGDVYSAELGALGESGSSLGSLLYDMFLKGGGSAGSSTDWDSLMSSLGISSSSSSSSDTGNYFLEM